MLNITYIDHDALKHLHSQDKVSAQHASWSAYLQQFTFVVKHKAGVTNRVANALSWWNNLLIAMRLKLSSFDSFCDLLDTDPYFSFIMPIVRDGEQTDFCSHDGFHFKGNQLCVPDYSLRLWIFKKLHGERHIGRDCT